MAADIKEDTESKQKAEADSRRSVDWPQVGLGTPQRNDEKAQADAGATAPLSPTSFASDVEVAVVKQTQTVMKMAGPAAVLKDSRRSVPLGLVASVAAYILTSTSPTGVCVCVLEAAVGRKEVL